MFARKLAVRDEAGDDLFARIGVFLRAQGLGIDPANYAFAHQLLTRRDEEARRALAQAEIDGIRLSHREIEQLGGNVVAGPGMAARAEAPSSTEAAADRLVEQTRVQVEAVASMMRVMHDETRGFGRDLAESAAAFEVAGQPAPPDEVVRLTQTMIARVTDAETRLEQAASEADALRAELAEAQESARRDPLTGLPNRRAFDEAFAAAALAEDRCLAVCDIDRFKAINDAFGHAVGDRVLSAVARVLADECDGHLVSRQGGEEFALLIGGSLSDATRLLDQAREAVGARRFRTRDTDAPIDRVSFSAGIVMIEAGEDAESALARADALLYRAKAAGRDRVLAA